MVAGPSLNVLGKSVELRPPARVVLGARTTNTSMSLLLSPSPRAAEPKIEACAGEISQPAISARSPRSELALLLLGGRHHGEEMHLRELRPSGSSGEAKGRRLALLPGQRSLSDDHESALAGRRDTAPFSSRLCLPSQ